MTKTTLSYLHKYTFHMLAFLKSSVSVIGTVTRIDEGINQLSRKTPLESPRELCQGILMDGWKKLLTTWKTCLDSHDPTQSTEAVHETW